MQKLLTNLILFSLVLIMGCASTQSIPNINHIQDIQGCSAKLKYRSVDKFIIGLVFVHTFWDLNDGTNEWIISGQPKYDAITNNTNLTLTTTKVIEGETIKPNTDNMYEMTAWASVNKINTCKGISKILEAVDIWPKNLEYKWEGPNSNSISKVIGEIGGFVPPASPPLIPFVLGWDAPLDFSS